MYSLMLALDEYFAIDRRAAGISVCLTHTKRGGGAWHGALIASLRALFAYLRTLLAGISEKARRADERTRVLWVGSKQWLQPCGSALFDHKLCVQRSGGFDGFQNIYQIARRHAERVKPFHDL